MSIDVSLQALSLRYGDTTLFSELSLQLKPASWTCIVGRSGVGKSSLLRALAGLPFAGEFSGRVVTGDNSSLANQVAWMAQEDLLLPWLNVTENVCLGARLRGELSTQTRSKAQQLLQQVGLASAAEHTPAMLSGGMRQRAALARTLFEDRPVVLMDEPFSAVDAVTRSQLQTLAATVLQGKTVLFITHDPLEALRLADHVSVLSGSPATIIESLSPEGDRPRRLNDPQLLAMQAHLLEVMEGGS